MDLTCEYCGKEFERTGKRGTIPKYCSPSHRQAAYRERNGSPLTIRDVLKVADQMTVEQLRYVIEHYRNILKGKS